MTGPMHPEPPPPPRTPVRPGYWFRPRLFGWGAAPATWQGWVLTLVIAATAIGLGRLADQRGSVWLVLLGPLLLGFVVLAWIKTDGEWRWRWGSRD